MIDDKEKEENPHREVAGSNEGVPLENINPESGEIISEAGLDEAAGGSLYYYNYNYNSGNTLMGYWKPPGPPPSGGFNPNP